jgi:hypothetical protein
MEEVQEQLQAFFKCVYNKKSNEWFLLDFKPFNNEDINEEKKYKQGSFILQKINLI